MEKIDLSTNSRKIQEAYERVVGGDPSTSYAVFTVNKNSILEVSDTGSGGLEEFVSHFEDGVVQFGLARVTVPGSEVSKNLLLGWCPDSARAKSRLSFATNFTEVSRILNGYHVQITARDQDDLDVNDFLERIGAAAGASYSAQMPTSLGKPSLVSKPFVAKSTSSAPKPAINKPFLPKSTGKPIGKSFAAREADDEWGGEKELEERDFDKKPLEDLPSAYKPTKVNIEELRMQKPDTISSKPVPSKFGSNNETTDHTPTISERMGSFESKPSDGRLTELPKPKIVGSVASRFQPAAANSPSFGSKPSIPDKHTNHRNENLVGGLSRDFAAEGGKTPAQIWAEKRGKYKSVSPNPAPVNAEGHTEVSELAHKFESQNLDEDEPSTFEPSESTPRNTFPLPPRRNYLGEKKQETGAEDVAPPLAPRNIPAPFEASNTEAAKSAEEDDFEDEEPAPSLASLNAPPTSTQEPEQSSFAPSLPSRSEVKQEAMQPTAPARMSSGGKPEGVTAVAEYDYEKDEDNEVGFSEGDLIVGIEFVDEEWWSGKNSATGETGLFPASYVSLKSTESPQQDSKAAEEPPAVEESVAADNKPSAVAEYDYEKDEDNEIGFNEGDVIVDIDFVDDSWWSGRNELTGEMGLFPANYVKLRD